MAKNINYSNEARLAIKEGVDKLANVVKVTLGPRGRNVIIEKPYGQPVVTKDGVTVAKEIELEDKLENIGAMMVKEVSSKTADIAGDGTTTATVLAQAIYSEGLKNVTAGANPMDLKRGIEYATKEVRKYLKKIAKPVNSSEHIAQIATISANGDKTIGTLISEAMDNVGKNGVITVEESNSMDTELEIVEGLQFNQGYLSPYFVKDNSYEVKLENPYILLHDSKITAVKDIMPILQLIQQQGRSLLIVSDMDGEALAALIVNSLKGILNVAAVKAPGFGDNKMELLKDIAALTGASVISESIGRKLETSSKTDLGSAKLVRITKDKTIIVDGQSKESDVEDRINYIKNQIETTKSDYEKEKLQERLAKMTGGVAVIRIGASTEVEMKEKKDRVEDALHATRAAVEEGIVPGGGVALLRASESITIPQDIESDQLTGINIVKKALKYPMSQIIINSGQEPSVIIHNILSKKDVNWGYDAGKLQYGNLIELGILDPVKVSRVALENAASVSALLLTTEAAITEIPNENINQDMSNMGGLM